MSKTKEKPRNIFKSVTCFNKILWLFGLGFFEVETGKTQRNLCHRMRFLLNLICSIFAMVIVLSEENQEIHNYSMIVTSAWHYQYQFQSVLILPLMIFNYVKRKHVKLFLRKLCEFDEKMEEAEWMKFDLKITRFRMEMGSVISSMTLLLFSGLFMLGICLEFEFTTIQLMRVLTFLFVTEFYLLITLQFIFAVVCVHTRFVALNTNFK